MPKMKLTCEYLQPSKMQHMGTGANPLAQFDKILQEFLCRCRLILRISHSSFARLGQKKQKEQQSELTCQLGCFSLLPQHLANCLDQ